MKTLLAQYRSPLDFFGNKVEAPPGIEAYGGSFGEPSGLILLLSNIFKISMFAGGIFALINFIVAGIQYISSSGNPETIKSASSKIWMSLLGLTIIVSSLVIAGLIGLIFFNDPTIIINPKIPTPTP